MTMVLSLVFSIKNPNKPNSVTQAYLGKDFINNDNVALVLGDSILWSWFYFN